MNKRILLIPILIFIAIFFYFPSSIFAWYKDNIGSYQYTESGTMLPPRGMHMGAYYTGTVNVLQGREWNQLVIEAEAYSATTSGKKSDTHAYLFCIFLRDIPLVNEYSSSEEMKEIIVKTSKDDYCQSFEGKKKVNITIPDDANYVQVELWSGKSSSRHEGYLQEALGDIYGYSMDGNQYAYFYLRR